MLRIRLSFLAVAFAAFLVGRWSSPSSDQSNRSESVITDVHHGKTSFSMDENHPRAVIHPSDTHDVDAVVENQRLVANRLRSTGSPECELVFSFVDFLESRSMDARDGLSSRPVIRVASLARAANFLPNEKELYSKLGESFKHMTEAKERFKSSPTLENKVMLCSWLLIHGEMQSLPPASRAASSLQALEEGELVLAEIKDKAKTPEAKIIELEQKNPNIAVLLHTMSLRAEVVRASMAKSTDTLIAENKHKTQLVSKYRELAYLILQADSSFHLQEWNSAASSFKNATTVSKEIEELAALDKSDVLDAKQLNLLKTRRPFMFDVEPVAAHQPNPAAKEFIENIALAKLLPTISALARLRLIQGDATIGEETKTGTVQEKLKAIQEEVVASLTGPDTPVTDDNALGYVVRGLAHEAQAMLLVENAITSPGIADPQVVLEKFEAASKSAIDDLEKAKTLVPQTVNNPRERLRIANSKFLNSAVAATDLLTAVKLTRNIRTLNALAPNPTFDIVEHSQQRLKSPAEVQQQVTSRLNDGRGDEAWRLAQQLVLRHPKEETSWSEYLVTGMRTYQAVEKLEADFKLAVAFGVFKNEPWREHELSGRLALYSGRNEILKNRSVIDGLLLDKAGRVDQEVERLQRSAKSFKRADVSFKQSLEGAKAKGNRDYLRVRAFQAQAGALLALVSPMRVVDDLRKFEKDARFAVQQATDELKTIDEKQELAAKLDLLESYAVASQATGLLSMFDADPATIKFGKVSLAVSNDVFGTLKFGGQGLVENGSLLLSALLARDDPTGQLQREPQMRRALQMLVEGLVLGDLGSPDYGSERVDRANKFLHADTGSIAKFVPPTERVFGLHLGQGDDVDAGGVEKIARLSGLLLRLKQQSSVHSRVLGDIAQPTPIDANQILVAALAVIDNQPADLTLPGVRNAMSRTERPVDAICLALAAEAKARALRFSNPAERLQWTKLAQDIIQRSEVVLQVESDTEFTRKYPLLYLVQKELKNRITSSVTDTAYLSRAGSAKSRFNFDEAEQRLRDGLAHHPQDSRMWQELATLALTRLDVDQFSGISDANSEERTLASLAEVFKAWRESKPDDGWKQDLLHARFLSMVGRNKEALVALNAAENKLPPGDIQASTLITSKTGEITAKLLLTGRTVSKK